MPPDPLLHLDPMPSSSPTPLPHDHARMLVELLQPMGPELARRWLAALLLVPRGEREGFVAAIERRIVDTYGPDATTTMRELHVLSPPLQRGDHVEQVETTYDVVTRPPPAAAGTRTKRG